MRRTFSLRFLLLILLGSALGATRAGATPRVNSMPGTQVDPAPYRPGLIDVWGNANGGNGSAIGFLYKFQFEPNADLQVNDDGDLRGIVTDDRFIDERITVTLVGSATRATLRG